MEDLILASVESQRIELCGPILQRSAVPCTNPLLSSGCPICTAPSDYEPDVVLLHYTRYGIGARECMPGSPLPIPWAGLLRVG